MQRKLQGEYVVISRVGEPASAFVPAPLPPQPPIEWGDELRHSFEDAHRALGRLDGVSLLLPDPRLFLYTYVRKEAVLSSQIEGTQSSLSDLLLFELGARPGVPLDDVTEVSNYVAAQEHGLRRLEGGFPLSNRLLREMHEILLHSGRGSRRAPGQFRRSQNWIGGSRPGDALFVPPPADRVAQCMGDLERFLHDGSIPPLLKAALAHVQFETIHPFLDGNGRLGRLLITLLLCAEGLLTRPLLYLSLHFKTHRARYYALLNQVRISGDWEGWLQFFAEAVSATATAAADTVRRLLEMQLEDREAIRTVGRSAGSILQVHEALMERPLAYAAYVSEATRLSAATTNRALDELQSLGIVEELTGQKRNRIWAYTRYIELLSEGTEPLPRT